MRMVKTVTVTLTIETECEDMDLIEKAILSELSGTTIDYNCVEEQEDESEVHEECLMRIATAQTADARIDSGISANYMPEANARIMTQWEGLTFVSR